MKNKPYLIFPIIIAILFSLSACQNTETTTPTTYTSEAIESVSLEKNLNESYTIINNNIPAFSENEITTVSFEQYSELDDMGRCGIALACIGTDLMPTEERGSIGQIRPSGWHLVKYDIVDGKYLYNRCHLIGYQLSGENANEKNLITGTRYLNVTGMLPFEDMVADYVKETGNHVMYRVTPVFSGDNLLADGVQMEAYSVEDGAEGISFNVLVYNKQPGIVIDYATGESYLEGSRPETETSEDPGQSESGEMPLLNYVLNTNTMRFHRPECESVNQMKEKNRKYYKGSREQLINDGYVPCGSCKP